MSTDQVATVVALICETLSDAVLGIYLHGSSVFGSLKPTSDLDLFVVTSRRTTGAERRELIEHLLPISGPGDPSRGSRSVNFEIVAQSDVQPWRYPTRLDFQFGDWYRPDFARGDFAPWNPSNPDLAIVLEMVLQANSPLFGLPPSELFGPIPWADVRRAMLDSIPDLLSYLDGDERNVVLTFARIWATISTGRFHSKDVAADWALARLPKTGRAPLDRARDAYLGLGPDSWLDQASWRPLLPAARSAARLLAERIEALSARSYNRSR